MAITFDTDNRVIMLDSFNTSASDIWTAWVDWAVQVDNLKYLPAFSQVGGVAPIALYLLLENGWRVRPQEADGITTITGNLLVQGGGSPITNTIDSWQILVNMETPVAAQAIETGSGGSGGGLSESDLHNGLDSYNNKNDWKATNTVVDLQPVLDKIDGQNDISVSDIEASNVLAKEATVSQIPTTDSVADIQPVLDKIDVLNDVTASEVRAAFNPNDFKDKNTEGEVHSWLDSYSNKGNWKANLQPVLSNQTSISNSIASVSNQIKNLKTLESDERSKLLSIPMADENADSLLNKVI